MAARTTKVITDKAILDSVINIAPEDITSTYVMELFGAFNGKNRCNPYDVLTVPAGAYGIKESVRGCNKKPFTTTVGHLIFNKMYVARNRSIYEIFGWFDDIMTDKAFDAHYEQITYKYIEGEVSLEDLKRFALTTQLTMPYIQFLSPSYTDEMLLCGKSISKVKSRKIKENQAAVDSGDLVAIDQISKETLAYSKDLLKDDPSMDTFNSGAGGSFGNNFKNMFVMRGTVRDPDPNKGYNFIASNYMDGVSADEYAALANTLAEGPYSRSKKTEVGGYWEKLMLYAYQHLRLDEPGSDCGTKRFILVKLTKKNIADWMYNYVIEGNRLVEITSNNMDKYIGHTVKMRFSALCKHPGGFCNKCAGNFWYRIGVRDIGIIAPQVPSVLKNLMMKAFHDSQVVLVDIDVMEAFCPDMVATKEAVMDLP